MRFSSICLSLAGAVALAGCGSSDKAADGPISPEEAAASMADLETPRAGQYKATAELLEIDIPGLPDEQVAQMKGMMTGAMTAGNSYCLTAEEAEQGARQMAEKLAEGDCTFNKFEVGGNSLDAEMVCKDKNGLQGNVKLTGTMTRESSDMLMEMNQKVPNMPGKGMVHRKMKMVSKRTGDCTS